MIVFSIQYINPCDFYVYKTFTKQLKMKKTKVTNAIKKQIIT